MSSDSFFLFFGTDEQKVFSKASEHFKNVLSNNENSLDEEVIDGRASSAEEVFSVCSQTVEALQTLPFFGGKVVWLKQASFLGENPRVSQAQRSQEGIEMLMKVLSKGIPKDTHFLLSALRIDKRRSFYKELSKIAKVQVFDLPELNRSKDYQNLESLIINEAKNFNLVFEKKAIELFALFVGNNLRIARMELEKMSLYLGEKKSVDINLVRLLVAPSDEGILWEINEALENKKLGRALSLISNRLSLGQSSVALSRATILPIVRRLLLVKSLLAYRCLPLDNYSAFSKALEEIEEVLQLGLKRKKDGSINAYPLYLSAKSAHNFSTQSLRKILLASLSADMTLVTSAIDNESVFTQLLARWQMAIND